MNTVRLRYAVVIRFEDGDTYENHVHAYSRDTAFCLALQDARMGSPFGGFYGPVKSWDAVVDDEVTA